MKKNSKEKKRVSSKVSLTNIEVVDNYIKDILERHDVRNEDGVLSTLLNILSSSVGSLTNATNIANTFLTIEKLQKVRCFSIVGMHFDGYCDTRGFIMSSTYGKWT